MVTIALAVAMDMIRNDKIVEITEQRQQKDIRRLHEVRRERERERKRERQRERETERRGWDVNYANSSTIMISISGASSVPQGASTSRGPQRILSQ